MAEMYTFMVECIMLCLVRNAANENRISSVVGNVVRLC